MVLSLVRFNIPYITKLQRGKSCLNLVARLPATKAKDLTHPTTCHKYKTAPRKENPNGELSAMPGQLDVLKEGSFHPTNRLTNILFGHKEKLMSCTSCKWESWKWEVPTATAASSSTRTHSCGPSFCLSEHNLSQPSPVDHCQTG
jgi:hypothetical protein